MAEELTGKKIDYFRYAAGYIGEAAMVVPNEKRLPPVALKRGTEVSADNIINEMTHSDVIIKGANALDPDGVAGVMMANPTGGTTGSIIGTVMARGINLIIPVGLEKSIPYSVIEIARKIGCRNSAGQWGCRWG